jgi:hypothetical protein
MQRKHLISTALALATVFIQSPIAAQGHNHPTLHVDPRWKECSFRLHPSLTQAAWRQFTEEAGLVVYFRPLVDARPMGRGRFEVSLVQWETAIDDHDSAWNDTFVHPDSTHYLLEGHGLRFPGLLARAGLTSNTDVGVYLTKNPDANYGFFGGQLQRSFGSRAQADWAAAARVSFVSLYGPDDLDFTVYGADLVASRDVPLSRWASVSPYAGVSAYLSNSREKSSEVNLSDERVLGGQAMVGAAVQLSAARLAVEYSVAKVSTISLKVGFGR